MGWGQGQQGRRVLSLLTWMQRTDHSSSLGWYRTRPSLLETPLIAVQGVHQRSKAGQMVPWSAWSVLTTDETWARASDEA